MTCDIMTDYGPVHDLERLIQQENLKTCRLMDFDLMILREFDGSVQKQPNQP